MPLRDYFVAPADEAAPVADATEPAEPRGASRFGLRRPVRARAAASPTVAPSLAVLAPPRDLPAVAAAAGLVLARGAPAVLVCVYAARAELATSVRAPARGVASRLAASLGARGLAAEARGRLVLVNAWPSDGDEEPAGTAARALAVAGPLPAVLAVAVRDADVDVLLATQDAILVALPPSAESTLAELAVAGASELSRAAAGVFVAFDPVSRALALGGLRAPRGLREAVEGLVG